MKVMKNLLIASCSLVLLTQCAGQDEIRKLNYQIRSVNQKVEEIKAKTVSKMQQRQASSVNKIVAIQDESQQLRALIDECNHKNQQLNEQSQSEIAGLKSTVEQLRMDYDQRIKDLELKVDQLSQTMIQAQQERVQAAEMKAREAARRAEEARKRTVVAADVGRSSTHMVIVRPGLRKTHVGSGRVVDGNVAPKEKKSSSVSSESSQRKKVEKPVELSSAAPGSDQFNRALKLYEAGKYKDAYKGFEQVLQQNPQRSSAAQTLFYMGECLYQQREYDLAILEYQKVISNHSSDPHTPAAMLKQGMSFEKLTDRETAKIIYKKLIADHPGTSEAGLAKKRLSNL